MISTRINQTITATKMGTAFIITAWPTNEPKPAVIWEAFKPETEPRRTIRKEEIEEQAKAESARAARGPAAGRDSDFLQREGGIY